MKTVKSNAKPLFAAIAALLAIATTGSAFAQSGMERTETRRAKQAQKTDANESKPAAAPQYPNATRQEPEAKASAKNSVKLKKLFDAYDKGDAAITTQAADEIIADPDANAYEHAVSARLAGASLINSDNARAKAYFNKAVDFNGLSNNEHFESMFLLAQLQLQTEQYAESLATMDKFLAETKSQQPEQLVVKGNALYRLKRNPEAAAVLKQAVASSAQPKADWLQLLMQVYFDMNQPAEAAKIAEDLSAKNPDDKRVQMNLASIYMQGNQDDKASAILEKLRASGQLSDETDYRNLYAMYLNSQGKEKQAIAVINEGMQKGLLKPDYQTYNALAQAYFFSEQPGAAIDAYQKAAPLAPDGEAYLNLARVLNNEGRAAEAKQAAQQALDKGVKKPEDARKIIGAAGK